MWLLHKMLLFFFGMNLSINTMLHLPRLGRLCIPHYLCNKFFRTLWVRMALFAQLKIFLNLEAVNLPHLWLNHSWLFNCAWVFLSTLLSWSSDESSESVKTWLSIVKLSSGSHGSLKLLARSFKVPRRCRNVIL